MKQGLRSQLTLAGYEHVSQVIRPGEYGVRGGLIDLFPMGSELPYRIDLFGDADRDAAHLRSGYAAKPLSGRLGTAAAWPGVSAG